MRTFRILIGASFLFFCTTLMHATVHLGSQDPRLCSNGGAQEIDPGTPLIFSPYENGTSSANGGQYLCFLNGYDSTWTDITISLSIPEEVYCDSQPNQFGTAFSCSYTYVPGTDLVSSINFFTTGDETGIPSGSNLLIDLNPCSDSFENCALQGAGNDLWPSNEVFTGTIPEPTSLALLGTGLLVTFRRRLLNWKA